MSLSLDFYLIAETNTLPKLKAICKYALNVGSSILQQKQKTYCRTYPYYTSLTYFLLMSCSVFFKLLFKKNYSQICHLEKYKSPKPYRIYKKDFSFSNIFNSTLSAEHVLCIQRNKKLQRFFQIVLKKILWTESKKAGISTCA